MMEPAYIYQNGINVGRGEIADFIFDMLEEERHYWSNFPSEYGKVNLIDKITARLDAYMDDMKEEWNV